MIDVPPKAKGFWEQSSLGKAFRLHITTKEDS